MSWYVRTQTGWGLRGIFLSAFLLLLYRAKLKAGSLSGIPESLEFWPLMVAGKKASAARRIRLFMGKSFAWEY